MLEQSVVDNKLLGYSGREMLLLTLEHDKLVTDHRFKSHTLNITSLHFDSMNAVTTTDDGEMKLWEFTQNNHKSGLTKMLSKTA